MVGRHGSALDIHTRPVRHHDRVVLQDHGPSQGGGTKVAKMLGGSPVKPNTGDAAERKLLNVVEEMAIAAGVPVPTVYVMHEKRVSMLLRQATHSATR
jgi:hypothetical protein